MAYSHKGRKARSAKTGDYVNKKWAEANPDKVVWEKDKKTPKKKKR